MLNFQERVSGVERKAPSQPVIADRVFEQASTSRQRALNRIEVLQVELANERAKVARCDEFLRLYSEFAQGAG